MSMTNQKIKPGKQYTDTTNAGRQDAFHVPSILVTTDHQLQPSQDVQLNDDRTEVHPVPEGQERHAIVDPFLKRPTQPNMAFWVFLIPDLIKDLTHNFDIDLPQQEPTEYFQGQGYNHGGEESSECANC